MLCMFCRFSTLSPGLLLANNTWHSCMSPNPLHSHDSGHRAETDVIVNLQPQNKYGCNGQLYYPWARIRMDQCKGRLNFQSALNRCNLTAGSRYKNVFKLHTLIPRTQRRFISYDPKLIPSLFTSLYTQMFFLRGH
jgi:hypothetical protein